MLKLCLKWKDTCLPVCPISNSIVWELCIIDEQSFLTIKLKIRKTDQQSSFVLNTVLEPKQINNKETPAKKLYILVQEKQKEIILLSVPQLPSIFL